MLLNMNKNVKELPPAAYRTILRSADMKHRKKHKKNGKDQYGTPLIINDSDVKIDWGQIIQEVRYDDSCTETEIQLLNEAVKKAVKFHGTDDEWKKEKCCPKCYPVYGIRKKIKIQKK